jgi:DNA-3-methyladenine glycosylase
LLAYDFYARAADRVARDLLGQSLCVKTQGQTRKGRIVETEAYLGEQDLAAHASKGRTKRTEVMFGPPGVAYVYLIYGMYDMFNIVVDQEGSAQAVLIRALEPLENISLKTDGPGKLCKAMKISRVHNAKAVFGPELWLERGNPPKSVTTTPRIGIDYAQEWKNAPLRFFDTESKWVSKVPKIKIS